jgi:hypothetical protein
MRTTFRKIVATALAATIATPVAAWAEEGPNCSRFEQVESDATGGDWVGGLLMYETTGSVSRSDNGTTTTTTTTTTTQVGVPGTNSGGSVTVTHQSNQPSTTITTQEPFGYYAMNDGSVYQINCVTGESRQLTGR